MNRISMCRSCDSKRISKLWQLKKSPYGDLFKTSRNEAVDLTSHSLTLAECSNCYLLQLLEHPDKEDIYENYLYRTSNTKPLSSYYKQMATHLTSEYGIVTEQSVLDIGSNDGSFLLNFKKLGYNVIGIEPSKDSSQLAVSKGIPTFTGYFNSEASEYIKAQTKHLSLITTNYVLANVLNLKEFISLVTELMSDETIFSVVTGYHPDQFAVNMFEYINHDHLSYFTLKSFSHLCDQFGLRVIDAIRAEHKGGSVQFVVSKKSSIWPIHSSVSQLAQREDWLRCNSSKLVLDLRRKINRLKIDLNQLIDTAGDTAIYGVGASISSTHFCNQFEVSKKIQCIFDDDINKIGLYAPGSGLPVKSLETVAQYNNSVLIILAWQHTVKILDRLKDLSFKGKVLIPLPTPILLEL